MRGPENIMRTQEVRSMNNLLGGKSRFGINALGILSRSRSSYRSSLFLSFSNLSTIFVFGPKRVGYDFRAVLTFSLNSRLMIKYAKEKKKKEKEMIVTSII